LDSVIKKSSAVKSQNEHRESLAKNSPTDRTQNEVLESIIKKSSVVKPQNEVSDRVVKKTAVIKSLNDVFDSVIKNSIAAKSQNELRGRLAEKSPTDMTQNEVSDSVIKKSSFVKPQNEVLDSVVKKTDVVKSQNEVSDSVIKKSSIVKPENEFLESVIKKLSIEKSLINLYESMSEETESEESESWDQIEEFSLSCEEYTFDDTTDHSDSSDQQDRHSLRSISMDDYNSDYDVGDFSSLSRSDGSYLDDHEAMDKQSTTTSKISPSLSHVKGPRYQLREKEEDYDQPYYMMSGRVARSRTRRYHSLLRLYPGKDFKEFSFESTDICKEKSESGMRRTSERKQLTKKQSSPIRTMRGMYSR